MTESKPTGRPTSAPAEKPWALHDAITNDPVHQRDYRTTPKPASKRHR
ncbi:hypothetical protein [Amycolatopsis sp. H20-H5]|nr:hypothetical protein [Amycolatopsis sp. H20-H5]MEC3976249.1 hypothetical protein [Amycolatopsis sp. H20-H5]